MVRDVGKELSKSDYDLLDSKQRDEIVEYLMYVSRKIILECDVIEIHDELS